MNLADGCLQAQAKVKVGEEVDGVIAQKDLRKLNVQQLRKLLIQAGATEEDLQGAFW